MKKQPVVLFVCSGNTCRSVMAQGLFTKIWKDTGEKNIPVIVRSAGTETVDGLRATEEALEVLRGEGVDLKHHRSRRINDELIDEADYIFTMTGKQKEILLERFPAALGKVHLMWEFAAPDKARDILDPFGRGLEQYLLTGEEIRTALREIIKKMTINLQQKADEEI